MVEDSNLPVCVQDPRLGLLWRESWKRVPAEVKQKALNYITRVSEIDFFEAISWNLAKWGTDRHIQISLSACSSTTDNVVIGAMAHEIGHAYEAAVMPGIQWSNSLAVWKFNEALADFLPCE